MKPGDDRRSVFAIAMRKGMTRTGATLAELAKRCDCSVSYLNNIEKGNAFGNDRVLRCVQRELGLSDDDRDLHCYQWGRMPDDLQFGDLEHVRECLIAFRQMMLS